MSNGKQNDGKQNKKIFRAEIVIILAIIVIVFLCQVLDFGGDTKKGEN